MIGTEQMVEDGGLAVVGDFALAAEAQEYALVVLAMNLDCWIKMEAETGRCLILAEVPYALAIQDEFALYTAEQHERVEPIEVPLFKSGAELAILWITSLLVVFGLQGEDPGFTDRFCNSSLAVIDGGEWWRPFTSLFLHGDFNHMIGNIGFGVIFCILVAHTVGPVLGWVLILASGTIGNLLTAGIRYPEQFQSVGASTATFGALGILVGVGAHVAWLARSYRKLGAALVPVGAGVIMLGWFGAGGENTDVAAHVAGFGVGGLLGLVASGWQMRKQAAGTGVTV